MPKRHWLHCAAVGGSIVVLCIGLSNEGHAQGNAATQPEQPQQQQQAPAPPPVVQQPVTQSNYHTVTCERPKDHNEADLCEQRRQAKAAEDNVWWLEFQTYLGMFGATLVICSLVLSGWAAVAAARAAEASARSVGIAREEADIARNQFSLTHRPRLRVRKVIVPQMTEGEGIAIEAEIANVGDTKAILKHASYAIEIPRDKARLHSPEPEHLGAASSDKLHFIEAGGHLILRLKTSLVYRDEKRFQPEHIIAVRGELLYSNVFPGNPFDIEAKARFEPTVRKTAFERFFHDRSTRTKISRFRKCDPVDPEYEYED